MTRNKRDNDRVADSQPLEIPVGSSEEEPNAVKAQGSAPPEEGEAATEPEKDELTTEQELRKKCTRLEEKVEELEDLRLRAMADLDNYRKRMTRQFDDMVRSSNDRILAEFLEIVDNFERALQHARNDEVTGTPNAEALLQGTELIYSQMKSLLERYGVTPIESVGKPFDPKYHEALMQVASDQYDDGIVAQEINKGYLIGDRVLRHARVAVSRGKQVSDQEEDEA
jgi:molecular chaperone GrpE